MYKKINPLFLLCETPLHAGSGDDLGMVDLPIQRERHTSYPKIESSSLKGALREAFEVKVDSKAFTDWDADDVKIHRFFGYDDGSLTNDEKKSLSNRFTKVDKTGDDEKKIDASEFAGCLAFTDARILLFPVKSMKGVFVWITCPQVLSKFSSDLKISNNPLFRDLPELIRGGNIQLSTKRCLTASDSVCIKNNVVLEDYAFEATRSDAIKKFAEELADIIFSDSSLSYWNSMLKTNLVVLCDDDFRDFVNHSTEVVTRTKIDNNTGTVQDGALFTEEYLPTDSILYSLVMASKEYGKKVDTKGEKPEEKREEAEDVMNFFSDTLPPIFQLGGNATIGKGLLRTKLLI